MKKVKKINRNSENQDGKNHSLFILTLFMTVLLSMPSLSNADINSFNLTFETENQSMWSTGNAFVLDYTNEFAKLDWNLSKEGGGIIGSVHKWCIFNKCYRTDTRTGAELRGSTSGYVGMEFTTHIDSGTVDVNYPVSIDLAFPDAYTIRPETNFQINSSYVVGSDASLYTSFPGLSAELSFLYNIQAQVGGDAYFLGDHYGGNETLINTGDQSFSLLSVSGQGVESPFLDLFQLADTLSNLSETTSENADKDKDDMTPDNNNDSKKKNVNLVDYFSIDVGIPDIYTIGAMDGNTLVSDGEDDFIRATLDLDNVLTTAFGLPELLGQSKNFGFGTVGYDILDVQAGAALAVTQEFSFDPGLKGRLDFSEAILMPVEVFDHFEINNDQYSQLAWNTYQSYVGGSVQSFCNQFALACSSVNRTEYQLSNSVEYVLGDVMDFMFPTGMESVFATPTFFLDNVFINDTGMRVDPLITERLLGFDLFGLSLSVYDGEQRFDVGADIDIFSTQFALDGFDIFTLDPFILTAIPESDPVPEPSTILLLGSGLLGLGWYGRKRKKV